MSAEAGAKTAIDWSFPRQILLAILIIGGIASYPVLQWYGRDVIIASFAGLGIATINMLMGFAGVEYSRGKSSMTFFKVVIGGMGVRLFLMAGVLALLVINVPMNTAALLWSLGIFYLVFLALEIQYIQKSVTSKQQD